MSRIDNIKTGIFTYKGKDYNFNFYTNIDTVKKIAFVADVVDTVVTEDHYQSILRGVIFDFRVISIFSDALDRIIDGFSKEKKQLCLEEDKSFSLTEIVDIVENTKIAEIIKVNAVEGLIDELNEAVDRDIEYKTGIHRNRLAESIVGFIDVLKKQIKDLDIKSLMGFTETMQGISGELTPEKIIEAYGKSEIFKQIREENDEKNARQTAKIIGLVDQFKEKKNIK